MELVPTAAVPRFKKRFVCFQETQPLERMLGAHTLRSRAWYNWKFRVDGLRNIVVHTSTTMFTTNIQHR